MKGQLTFATLIGYVALFILYFVFVVPVLDPLIATFVADQLASPNAYTPLMVTLAYLIPFIILVAMVVGIFQYAIPKREGEYR